MNRPRLKLVDDDGTVRDDLDPYWDVVTENEMQARELKGYRIRLSKLEDELADHQAAAKDEPAVRDVLDYWARRVVEQGWWVQTPTFEPGDGRWKPTRARLLDRYRFHTDAGEDDWDVLARMDLKMAVEGAVLQDKRRVRGGRRWVDVTSIFRNNENFDHAFQSAKDPMLEFVATRSVRVPFGVSTREVEDQFELCDCGHPRLRHHRQLHGGLWACFNCDCMDFDDFHRVCERWVGDERDREKQRRLREAA